MSGWDVVQRLNDTTNDWFTEELFVKAKTRQHTLDFVRSNVQLMGQNAVKEQLLHIPDEIGKSPFKSEKSLKWHKGSI